MKQRKKRESVIFMNDQMLLAEELLTESECGRLYAALRLYSIDRKLTDTSLETHAWNAIFRMMRSTQDDAIRKYDDTCERNRERALKRSISIAPAAAAGSQSNIIEDNIIESNDCPALDGQEESGVPGIEWL